MQQDWRAVKEGRAPNFERPVEIKNGGRQQMGDAYMRADQMAAAGPNGDDMRESSPLTPLQENFAENMASQVSIVHTVEAMQLAVEQFGEHVDTCNVDFKQQIMEKVKTLKKNDETISTERVEELKGQEGSELSKLNAIYTEKKLKVRQMEAQRDRNDQIIGRWVDNWHVFTRMKKLFSSWKEDAQEKAKEKRSEQFCEKFYERGLMFRSMRHMKLFAQVCGNRMHERRMKERITLEVKAKVEEMKAQQEFLEALIKELEEKHRIELRKKAILKNQCDQAYLRGVAAISNEALKMSHSTLDDFYKGMRQPRYDGSNVINQIKQLQGGATMQQQQVVITQTKTVEGKVVPPINAALLGNSQDSFDRHFVMSKTDQGASRMFNEQSFGH